MNKIPVAVSSCLLGEAVRYDGSHKYHSYIERTLGNYFEFRAFCPEVAAGFGTPRPAIQLMETASGIRCVAVKDPSQDKTPILQQTAREQAVWLSDMCGYILKKDSPSCGAQRVKVYKNGIPAKIGVGIFADFLQRQFPDLPIEDEGRLGDPALRENFIQRVFIRYRWRQLTAQAYLPKDLMRFHSRHKLIVMSHDQARAAELGRLVAGVDKQNQEQVGRQYLLKLMACLKIVASRGKHVNVLQHIQGYLKHKIDADDKLELTETIENYRIGALPLIVPVSLLRHHFRKQPDAFINDSYYMQPHPAELSLLNEI